MSVLIRGMEMPTSCDDCEFCKRDISSYDWCCLPMTNGRSKPLDEPVLKPDWCPLVPVPPHGRLIDADALIDWLYDDEPSPWKAPFRLCTADRSDVKFLLKNATTIIPAEEGE